MASANVPGSYKERQYDTNGYEDVVSDFEDGLTDFDYDDHGHLLKKVDGAGTSVARTTTYAWDEANNRLAKVTVVGDHETAYLYTGDGRIASASVKNLSATGVANQVQGAIYSYTGHSNGLLASMTKDGPLPGTGDAITYTYNQTGDLLSVKNGLGHTTTYANHNALGLAGRTTGPNGEVTDYTYDERGRTTRIRTYPNGVAADVRGMGIDSQRCRNEHGVVEEYEHYIQLSGSRL